MAPLEADNLRDAIGFFKSAFTIVMGLALGESLKQFVAERVVKEGDRSIHWDRLPSLFSFLFLILPFYQGMSRYLYLTYIGSGDIPPHYSIFLMIDGVNFLVESALFFVMARSLAAVQWQRYYKCVLLLLLVDSVWVWASWWFHNSPTDSWMFLNVGFAPVVLLMLWVLKSRRTLTASIVLMVIVTIRTALDYILSWSTVYFPPI